MVVDCFWYVGGPHNNEVWTIDQILYDGPNTWVADYLWTDETVVGADSGRTARKMVHISVA